MNRQTSSSRESGRVAGIAGAMALGSAQGQHAGQPASTAAGAAADRTSGRPTHARNRRFRASASRLASTTPARPLAGSSSSATWRSPTLSGHGRQLQLPELRLRLPGPARVPRQFQRIQLLQRRGSAQAAVARLDAVSRRPGRRLGVRQAALHVGGAGFGPCRLRRAGRHGDCQPGTLPRRSYFRHQRHREAEADCRRADLPRLAHAHARREPEDKDNIYIYGSGTSGVRSGDELEGCSGGSPTEDPNTALFSIDVIQVPLKAPETAKIVNRPRIFADPPPARLRPVEGRRARRRHAAHEHDEPVPRHHDVSGAGAGGRRLFRQRHPARHLGSRASEAARRGHRQDLRVLAFGDLQQRRDQGPVQRRVGRRHRAALPQYGSAHLGRRRGLRHRRQEARVRRLLQDAGAADGSENCVAHNGSIVPVPGRDIMVQAWYQGGLSMFDFTDSKHPVEIAYFDRGPIYAAKLLIGGYWSTYYYNGYIYGSEIFRGLDIFKPRDRSALAERDRRGRAREVGRAERAAPAADHVAGELRRGEGVPGSARAQQGHTAARAEACGAAMDRAEKSTEAARTAAVSQLGQFATQLDADAGKATGIDAKRPRARPR